MRRIGIDVDDCIAKTSEHICKTVFEITGKKIEKETLKYPTCSLNKLKSLTSAEIDLISQNLLESRFLNKVIPYEGARDVCEKLTETGAEIFFIISADYYDKQQVLNDTAEWLNRYRFTYKDVVFTKDKAQTAIDLNLDEFFEDRIGPTVKLISYNRTLKLFLIDQPWNRYKIPFTERVKRLSRWDSKEILS